MMLRIMHLNSMLTGGGTDDHSVRIAHSLLQFGHRVWLAGPDGREYSQVARQLGLPFRALASGKLKTKLVVQVARFIRSQGIQIIQAHHGRDYWPAILAARLSGLAPKIVLSRHLAKSPSSWASSHFLLAQCDALVAVSHFVAKILREGDADPGSDNPERHQRQPIHGDYSKIHVVYGGFDMHRFQPGNADAQRKAWGLDSGNYVFAVVGAYDPPRGKGQPEFLRAAAHIRHAVPKARFLII